MNWIECSPEEATRATINGKELVRSRDSVAWWLPGRLGICFTNKELSILGARFEKEAPKEWVVEFNCEGRTDVSYTIADGLREIVGGDCFAYKAVANRKYLVRDITNER